MKEKFRRIGAALSNYWYHYKWVTIITAFFVVVIGICIFQMAGEDPIDISAVYAGPEYLSEDAHHELNLSLEQIMSKDYDNDGKKNVQLIDLLILSDEQIKERDEQAREEDKAFIYDPSSRNSVMMSLGTYLSTGEAVLCFLDPYVYESFAEKDAFVPLTELLGYRPEGAYDDFAVRLSDVGAYKYYSALSYLPDDTLVCLKTRSYMYTTDEQIAYYERHIDYFKRLFTIG